MKAKQQAGALANDVPENGQHQRVMKRRKKKPSRQLPTREGKSEPSVATISSAPIDIKGSEPMPLGELFKRPGVSDAFLTVAGCAHVDENECARLYGFKAAGIAIPFRHLYGSPIVAGGRAFGRGRPYHATEEPRYHQPP